MEKIGTCELDSSHALEQHATIATCGDVVVVTLKRFLPGQRCGLAWSQACARALEWLSPGVLRCAPGACVTRLPRHLTHRRYRTCLELDLEPAMHPGTRTPGGHKYQLGAVVEHTGSGRTPGGHYKAYGRGPTDQWHQFNDRQVRSPRHD